MLTTLIIKSVERFFLSLTELLAKEVAILIQQAPPNHQTLSLLLLVIVLILFRSQKNHFMWVAREKLKKDHLIY